MVLKNAQIILDSPTNSYYPGQTINGRVEYQFDTSKTLRGIFVNSVGKAYASWSESTNNKNGGSRTRRYYGYETYFDSKFYIMGGPNENQVELPAGFYTFNFQIQLPPVLPSSFEGYYGHVRYTIKVTLDRPWKFFVQSTQIQYKVVSPVDPRAFQQPLQMQNQKNFCCLFCASGPLSVVARSTVSGYAPGQAIPISVDIDNKSSVSVRLVRARLKKIVIYRATGGRRRGTTRSKVVSAVVSTVEGGPVFAGDMQHINLLLPIPADVTPTLFNCRVISVQYEVNVTAKVSGMHLNLNASNYVTIGSAPPPQTTGVFAPTAPWQPMSPSRKRNSDTQCPYCMAELRLRWKCIG